MTKKMKITKEEAVERLTAVYEESARFFRDHYNEEVSTRIKDGFINAALGKNGKGNYRAVMCALAEVCATYCQMGANLTNERKNEDDEPLETQEVADCLHGLIDLLVMAQDCEDLQEALGDNNPNEHRLDCN